MRIVRSLSLLAVLCALCFGLTGCGVLIATTNDRVRPDSPLRSVIRIRPEQAKIRIAILQQLPIGSIPEQTKAFLVRNFRGVRYKVLTTRPRFRGDWLGWPEGPQIYFRPYDYEALSSVNYVEIHLMLDSNNRLKDVVVYRDNVSM